MGYSTYFKGEVKTDRPVDQETFDLLKGLQDTRRMKRNVGPEYGVDGEFYIKDDHLNVWPNVLKAQGKPLPEGYNIVDHNTPPSTQPGLWCQWLIQDDKQTIQWDDGEKFYNYIKWMEYIIERVLKPRGYIVSGEIFWEGEDHDDFGKFEVVDNRVIVYHGQKSYVNA